MPDAESRNETAQSRLAYGVNLEGAMARFRTTTTHVFPRPAVGPMQWIFIALLLLGVLAAAGCHGDGGPPQEDAEAFAWRGALAAPATVYVRNTIGTITIEPAADSQLTVSAATSWTRGDPHRDIQFNVVTSTSGVTVCAIWERGECSADGYSSRSTGGGIRARIGRRTDARVAFTVRVPAGVKVDARTVDGNVSVRAAAPVKARTINGDLSVGTAVGPVDAETVSGDVDVRMTTLEGAGDIRAVTKNGDAVAYVPAVAAGRLKVTTLNGEIGTDFGQPAVGRYSGWKEWVTTVGTGGREYLVQSLNGSAWLRAINADGTVGAAAVQPAASSRAQAAVTPPRPDP